MLIIVLSLALITITATGFHVFSVAPGRAENRAFAVFSWIMALWSLNDIVFWGFHEANEEGFFWLQAAFLLALGIQLSFLWFAVLFPKPRPLALPWLLAIGLGSGAAVVIVLTGNAGAAPGFVDGRFSLEPTIGTYIVGFVIYALFFAGRLLLGRSRAEEPDRRIRRQLSALIVSAWTTGIMVTVLGVVLPLFGIFELLPYTSLSVLVGSLMYGYAVLNFQLFQPASILDRLRLFPVTAKLSLSISTASLLTVFSSLVLTRLFLGSADPSGWKRLFVFGLLAASVPAMTLIFVVQHLVTGPLRRLSEAALEVAGGRTDVRVDVRGSRDEISLLSASFNDMVDKLERDIESMRAMSEGLLRSERLATAGALAAGVAHEVNNPLAAISSLVQIVRDRSDDPRSREQLEQALEQMERIATALKDLMELARPREEQRRRCELGVVAERTLRLLRYDRGFRTCRLELQLEPGLPLVDAGPDRIQQVLMNLLLNARDASSATPGAAIEVRTRLAEGFVVLAVSDTGEGIAPENLDRVFEPFFTTKDPGAGTGLGLAVCRDIIRAHDGKLDIDSEPGRGTTVELSVPVYARAD
jgi:signal transduction histidine kinase